MWVKKLLAKQNVDEIDTHTRTLSAISLSITQTHTQHMRAKGNCKIAFLTIRLKIEIDRVKKDQRREDHDTLIKL